MVVSIESQQVKVRKPIRKYKYNRINLNLKPYIKYIIAGVIVLALIVRVATIIPKMVFNSEHRVIPNSIELPSHSIDINNIQIDFNKYNGSLYKEHRLSELDKISTLSIKYNVSINTILGINKITDLKELYKKDYLIIPNTDGFIHKLKEGETLDDLSKKYKLTQSKIFSVNRLKSKNLNGIEEIFIPINKKGENRYTKRYFLYPVMGYISKRYGYHTNNITGVTSIYDGVDFIPTNDFNVYASKTGQISSMGYNANYGNYIFIDHPSGFRTLYAHLESIGVKTGDKVEQGENIGVIGSSGFTTKRKLFFCLLKGDKPVDPEEYLH